MTLPSSERASDSPMLMPAPTEAARPTKKVLWALWVRPAVAKSGASVETEPSIRPSRAGCTFCRTKSWSAGSKSVVLVTPEVGLIGMPLSPVVIESIYKSTILTDSDYP